MLVNTRGVLLVLGGILLVILICSLDLRCSGSEPPLAVERIRGELDAGRRAAADQRCEQFASELNSLRLMKRQHERNGNRAEARRLEKVIREMEQQYEQMLAAAAEKGEQ